MVNNLNSGIIYKKKACNNNEFTEQLELAKGFNKYLNEKDISLENYLPNKDINPLQFINRNKNSIY